MQFLLKYFLGSIIYKVIQQLCIRVNITWRKRYGKIQLKAQKAIIIYNPKAIQCKKFKDLD